MTKKWLLYFFDRRDISKQTPARKDAVYVGKVDGVR